MRAEFVMSEVSIGLRRNVTMTLAAVMTIAISLTLLGVALIIRVGSDRLQSSLINQLRVSVYLEYECGTANAQANACLTPAERTNIQTTLQGLPEVKNITYVSQAQGYKNFKVSFANNPALIANTPPAAIPESFAVQLKNPHQFEIVHDAVSQAPGVQSVTNVNGTFKEIFSFFHHLTLAALLLTLLLLVSTCLLIYNSMRVAAFSRRRETGIMRLVGASDFYIQAPFVLEGTAAGIAGAALAFVLLVLTRWYISANLAQSRVLHAFGEWGTLAHSLPEVLAIGIFLPAIASFLTLQRHLRV
jgi:cell division transport system permease protein